MRAKDCRPIFHSPTLNMWVVTRYRDVVDVLKDPRTFSSALAYGDATSFLALTPEARARFESVVPMSTLHLASADPPEHARLRKVLEKLFSSSAMSQFKPAVALIADRLIDEFAGQKEKEVDIVRQFVAELPIRSIARLIGVPNDDIPQLKQWYLDWTALALTTTQPERQLPLAGAVAEFHDYLIKLVESRRWSPQDDLTSQLVREIAARRAAITELELVNILSQLIAAGTETTMFAIGTCLWRLLCDPSQWGRVHSLEARPHVVEEALRCNQALRGLMRIATSDTTVGGVPVAAGARLYVMNSAANRDSAVFADPDRFDPDRPRLEVKRHIAFGIGIHRCLGAPLARLEMQVSLERLGARLPNLALVPDGVEVMISPVVRSLKAMRVRWG
jgi:cytochrome P450